MSVAARLLERCQVVPKTVLVIGDGMTDVYVHGRLDGECQDGCPKFTEESRAVVPGGAANAGASIGYWPAVVRLVCMMPGPIKTRFLAGGRCVFRYDDDARQYMPVVHKQAMEVLRAGQYHAVLLSDYDKGTITRALIQSAVLECKARGLPCVADVKRAPSFYEGCILKCNEDYAEKYARELEQYEGDVIITRGGKSPIVRCRNGKTY